MTVIESPKSVLSESPLNSDAPLSVSPFSKVQSAGFTIRTILRAWNVALGVEEWHLCPITSDKRIVVVSEKDTLFKRLTEADPHILSMVRDESREVYPRLTINVKYVYGCKYTQDGELSTELKMTPAEQSALEGRKDYDRLHDIRRSLGLGRAEANTIIRTEQGTGGLDWIARAEAKLRAAASTQTMRKPHEKALRYEAGMKATCVHCKEQYGAENKDAPYVYDNWTRVEGTRLWKCPKGHRTSDALMRISELDLHFGPKKPAKLRWANDKKELALFWANVSKAPGGFHQRGITTQAEKVAIVHEVIPSLHTTDLSREECEALVLKRLAEKFDKKEETPVAKTTETPWYKDDKKIQALKDKLIAVAAECGIKAGEIERMALDELEAETWDEVEPTMDGKDAYIKIAEGWRAHDPITQMNKIEQPQEEVQSEPEKAAKPSVVSTVSIRTLSGMNALDIQKELNKPLPPSAYGEIKHGQMSGKTDVDGDAVRDRFDHVFGPMGIGWRIKPQDGAGRVEYKTETRNSSDGKKQNTWHIVTLVAHTFEYSVVMADGSITWVNASTTSDQHDNMDEQYAYRGAFTSLMKQFYRLLGGMNHVIYGQYTHVQAKRDLAKKSA